MPASGQESSIALLDATRSLSTLVRALLKPPGIARSRTGSLLLPLLIAATIPVILFAGWMAYRAASGQRSAALEAASITVDRVAERIAAEINAQVQVAQSLALSQSLDAPDLDAFRLEAQRLKAARALWHTVELDDTNGLQIMNLLRSSGEPLGPTADRESFEAVVRGLRPVVGGIGPIGPVSAERLVALRVPVLRAGRLRYVLTITFAAAAVDEIVHRAGIPESWIGAVVDKNGLLIARSVADDHVFGQPAGAALRQAIRGSDGGFYKGISLEGTPVETIFRTMPEVGHWSVHLGVPVNELERPVRRALVAVAGGVLASLGLAAVLAVLTANAFARQRDEEASRATAALQASEDRGRLAIEAAGLGTWRWDVKAGHIVGSDRFRSLMNLPRAAIAQWSSTDFVERICADDREQVMKAAEDCLTSMQTFEIEYRANDDLGTPRWLRVLGRSLQAPQDQTIVGVLADITAQKKIEAERLDLLRRLSDAQENVQARIARELHDQVGQTVTGLSLGLKGLERLIEGADRMPSEVRDLVLWLQGLTGEIGRDLHRVAADLRPTALDDLGLSRSLAAYVADWSERYAIGVEVERVGADTARLPPDVETAVYRVVQEALTNVVKHASAQHVSVVIERRSNELRVLIEDDGVGFDPVATDGKQAAAAPAHRRLGLSGMRERLALVGGTLQIESSPEAGTTLFVRVPIPGPAAATARS